MTLSEPGPLHRTTRIALAVLLVLSHPLWAATIIVDETTCTLIDAVTAAETDAPAGGCSAGSGPDTIVLESSVVLTERDNNLNGLPRVDTTITVEGRGHTISRDPDAPWFRFFEVWLNGTLTLNEVTLTGGHVEFYGGAIHNRGALTVTNSTLTDNSARTTYTWASSQGGAIYNSGDLAIDGSTIDNNRVAADYGSGGGIKNTGNGSATITNSTISGNRASSFHYILATATGGGIDNRATLTLVNSTVTLNETFGDVERGSGIYNFTSTLVTLTNTVVAYNDEENCHGPMTDNGNNFDDDGSCGPGFETITGLDPVLADNGGPTRTHALLPESNAIDAAGDCGLETDQRGRPRNDGSCDSGSYEFQCSITVNKNETDTLIVFTPESGEFDVATGYLSDLRADEDFTQATCLGVYAASPAVDNLPEPSLGDGRYYLARGFTNCLGAGYGDSSLIPDPRDDLDSSGPCP